jgi:hypothetical protein
MIDIRFLRVRLGGPKWKELDRRSDLPPGW